MPNEWVGTPIEWSQARIHWGDKCPLRCCTQSTNSKDNRAASTENLQLGPVKPTTESGKTTAKLNTTNSRIQQEYQSQIQQRDCQPNVDWWMINKGQQTKTDNNSRAQTQKLRWDLWLLIWQLLNKSNANSKSAKQRLKRGGLGTGAEVSKTTKNNEQCA